MEIGFCFSKARRAAGASVVRGLLPERARCNRRPGRVAHNERIRPIRSTQVLAWDLGPTTRRSSPTRAPVAGPLLLQHGERGGGRTGAGSSRYRARGRPYWRSYLPGRVPASLYVVQSACSTHTDGRRLSLRRVHASGWQRHRHQRIQRRNGRLEGHQSSVPCHRHVGLTVGLTAKRSFESCKLSFDIFFNAPTFDDVFAIAAEEVIDGLNSNAYGAGGLVFVEIFEREVWRPGPFDSALNHSIDRSVVTALEAGVFESDQVRMT